MPAGSHSEREHDGTRTQPLHRSLLQAEHDTPSTEDAKPHTAVIHINAVITLPSPAHLNTTTQCRYTSSRLYCLQSPEHYNTVWSRTMSAKEFVHIYMYRQDPINRRNIKPRQTCAQQWPFEPGLMWQCSYARRMFWLPMLSLTILLFMGSWYRRPGNFSALQIFWQWHTTTKSKQT